MKAANMAPLGASAVRWPTLDHVAHASTGAEVTLAFVLSSALTLLCITWVLLGVALLGEGPSAVAFPIPLTLLVPLIIAMLSALTVVLAGLMEMQSCDALFF